MPPSTAVGAALLSKLTESAVRTLQEGDYLFRRGSPVEQLYVVRSGHCRLERTTFDGRTVVLAGFGPREIVADGSLFHPHYGCDCRATVPSTLAVYPSETILDLLGKQPEMARRWLASLAGEVMELRTRLELRNVKSARDRITLFLTLHADAQGCYPVDEPLKAIADAIGLTPEVLYRTLAELERSGIIARHHRMIEIIGTDR